MQLGHIPRLDLGFWPTPMHQLPRLGEDLGGPELWIKRDDQSGVAAGGNKVRRLEYVVGQALEQGADLLITTGGVQSNHARMTAAVGARLGLDVVLVLKGADPGIKTGNLLLNHILGARIVFEEGDLFGDGDEDPVALRMEEVAAEEREKGRRPFIVPLGGSTPTGCLGYVSAMLELLGQLEDASLSIDHLFVAAGSQGTAAGIYLGSQATSSGMEIHLISVARNSQIVREQTMDLAARTRDLLGWKVDLDPDHLHVYDQYVGEGYGIPTPGTLEAINKTASLEGIILDPTYTGKAMAGLIGEVSSGTIDAAETALFWHTGGLPGLFAAGMGAESGK